LFKRQSAKNGPAARNHRQALLFSTALIALVCAGMARAQPVTGSGDLSPGPAQTPSWTVGGDLRVGDTGIGQIDVTAGGALSNDTGFVGYDAGSIGVVTVSGGDAGGNPSTWTNTSDLVIGQSGTGSLNVLDGAQVNSLNAYIAADAGSQGTVTVSGIGGSGSASTWTNAGDLFVGYDGAGVLRILAGGRVLTATSGIGGGGNALVSGQNSSWRNSGRLNVGLYSAGSLRAEAGATISSADGIVGGGAQGDAVLTGNRTVWTNAGQFTVGSFGTGTLRLEDGATVTSSQGYIGANATGTVTVTGPGSKWLMSPFNLTIGNLGTGSLTIENGGLVRAEGGVLLGVSAGASGTLLVQGSANSRGVLETSRISGGAGAASATFDGALLRATDDNPRFFAGFDTRTIAIGANGVVIDTAGHDIGISPSLTGAGALIKDGAGKLELTGDSGATFTGAGGVLAGTLAVNGVLGGTMEVIGGRLQGIGTVGSTVNQPGGTIAPGNSIGTLTINGNYLGNGGRLEIETVLGGDASPSDRLVITGSTAGTTLVTVLNRGGAGAPTIEGIKIIGVGGASNGLFTLQGSTVFQGQQAVVAGAYAYTLQKNGISSPTDGNWYLRSAFMAPAPAPSPSAEPVVIGPIYQPGAPLYEAYGQVLQSLNDLQTLRQRVGDRFEAPGGASKDGTGRAIWARIDAAHRRITPGFSTTGTRYVSDSWRLQAGADGQLFANGNGTLLGGVTLHHGQTLAEIASVFGRGKIKAAGTGFGGALTWYSASGFYADAQTRLNWFDSDLSSTTTGRQLAKGKGGVGYALGLELGQRIALSGGWSLTPQTQLTYAHVEADSFVDPFGAPVALNSGGSLRGRLGLSADYRVSWRDSAGRAVNAALYGIANLHYEFLGGTTATVAGVPLTSRTERLWGGGGLGAKYETDGYALYGEVEATTSLTQFADSHSITGRAGLRVSW
jgi:outer membrane autotransporter protein